MIDLNWKSFLLISAGFFLKYFFDIIKNIESIEKISAKFWNIIKWAGTYPKRKTIEKELQGTINSYIKDIRKKVFFEEILPYGIKIEWQKKRDKRVYLKRGEVIIRLGYDFDHRKNFIEALIIYIEESLLPTIKHYFSPEFFMALKFVTTAEIACRASRDIYLYFLKNYYRPLFEGQPQVKKWIRKLFDIKKGGLFFPILLPSLSMVGRETLSLLIKPDFDLFQKEITGFINFLKNIATKRERFDEPPLIYLKNYIKIGVVLVSRDYPNFTFKYMPHIKRVKRNFEDGVKFCFITGLGFKNIKGVKLIEKELKKYYRKIDNTSYFIIEKYRHQKLIRIKGICVCFTRESK